VAGATPPGGQPAGLPAEGAPQAAEPFEIAGQKFTSRQEAEERIKQALGRYSSAQSEAAKLRREMEAIARQRDEAHRAATAWHDWYERNGGQRQGTPDPSKQPQADAQKEPWYNGLDYDLFQEVAEEKGLANALYGLVAEIDKHYDGRLKESIAAATAPLQQTYEQSQAFQQTMDLFGQVTEKQDATGAPLYPELADARAANDIVRIWRTLRPELALSTDGIEYAVWKYRQTNGAAVPETPPAAAQAAPAGASGASHGVLETAAQAAAASSEVLAGNGSPRPATGTQEAQSFKQLIAEAAPRAKTPDGFDLGFLIAQ
jgi:hypothetical protein